MEPLDILVRDLTKVGSIPKSEARRRIMELIEVHKLIELHKQKIAKQIIDDLGTNPFPNKEDVTRATLPLWIETKQQQLKDKYLI